MAEPAPWPLRQRLMRPDLRRGQDYARQSTTLATSTRRHQHMSPVALAVCSVDGTRQAHAPPTSRRAQPKTDPHTSKCTRPVAAIPTAAAGRRAVVKLDHDRAGDRDRIHPAYTNHTAPHIRLELANCNITAHDTTAVAVAILDLRPFSFAVILEHDLFRFDDHDISLAGLIVSAASLRAANASSQAPATPLPFSTLTPSGNATAAGISPSAASSFTTTNSLGQVLIIGGGRTSTSNATARSTSPPSTTTSSPQIVVPNILPGVLSLLSAESASSASQAAAASRSSFSTTSSSYLTSTTASSSTTSSGRCSGDARLCQ
ncbi:hypothetical protein MRB53_039307 [Persea americana]|nr:hypothetical protein MRB53_039307 [Persea americana]